MNQDHVIAGVACRRAGTRTAPNLRGLSLVCATVSAVILPGCGNPFFPPIGPPRPAISRESPRGVLKQLIRAYEMRRLTIFEDLFASDGTFRYYIPQTVSAEFAGLTARATVETIDRDYAFVDMGALYEYTRYTDEIAIHKNMFERSDDIIFMVEPDIDSVFYYDTVISVDSSVFTEYDTGAGRYDTVAIYDTLRDSIAAEVLTKGGFTIRITSEVIRETQRTDYADFTIGPQVFYLRRDPEDAALWVIDKWFELP